MIEKLKREGCLVIKDYAKNCRHLDRVRDFLDKSILNNSNLKSHDKHFAMVNEPYFSCIDSLILAIDPFIINIAQSYLKTKVGLGTSNLRKSFITTDAPITTNLFHMDENCGKGVRLIKAFYYLNDVTEGGGPFEYIRGSHTNRIHNWQSKIRWSDEEIYHYYGKENSIKLFANYGDLIIADTTGFHRGIQVSSQERSMMTMNYITQKEIHGYSVFNKNFIDLFQYGKL